MRILSAPFQNNRIHAACQFAGSYQSLFSNRTEILPARFSFVYMAAATVSLCHKVPSLIKVVLYFQVLRRDGFGEDRLFRCLVAELDSPGE